MMLSLYVLHNRLYHISLLPGLLWDVMVEKAKKKKKRIISDNPWVYTTQRDQTRLANGHQRWWS